MMPTRSEAEGVITIVTGQEVNRSLQRRKIRGVRISSGEGRHQNNSNKEKILKKLSTKENNPNKVSTKKVL